MQQQRQDNYFVKSCIKPNGTLLSFIHETHYFAMAQMVFYLIEHKHAEESDGCARNFIQIFNYVLFISSFRFISIFRFLRLVFSRMSTLYAHFKQKLC